MPHQAKRFIMTDKSYSIIFSSPTGNTRLLADTIRDALRRKTVIISE